MRKINVALVGLGFGGAFAGIYKEHPNVGELTICDIDAERAKATSDWIGGCRIASRLEDVLADPLIDAVHLVTPIPLHADQSVAVLEAGKHCACTVPMATSLDDIRRIVAAKRKSGKNYMMMETTLYTYPPGGEGGRRPRPRRAGRGHAHAEPLFRFAGRALALHRGRQLRSAESAGVAENGGWRRTSRLAPAPGPRVRHELHRGARALD